MDDNGYADMADENNSAPNVIPTDETLIASATKIQAVQRGRKSRVEVQEMKEQVLESIVQVWLSTVSGSVNTGVQE